MVITTFGGIGPAAVWHFTDSIYATSSSLANLNLTSAHAVATRKAHFLASLQAVLIRSSFAMLTLHTASLQAVLIRSSFAMLTLHTAAPTTAQPTGTPAPPQDAPPSPAPSIPTTDDDDTHN